MKRSWELIGQILESIENETLFCFYNNEDTDKQKAIRYHLELLFDAGYIQGIEFDKLNANWSRGYLDDVRLTMKGHDFKEIRLDPKLWDKVKRKALNAGVALSWEFITQAIPHIYKEILS